MYWKRMGKILLALVALGLFILGIKLMQMGAFVFVPFLREHFKVEVITNALGFGWGASYMLLSGSPVAAMAIAFFGAGQIDEEATFAMIMGSRFGAAFVALFIGFFYFFLYRKMIRELRIGLLALLVTFCTYLPALILGIAVLKIGIIDSLVVHQPAEFFSFFTNGPIEKIEKLVKILFPYWGWFLIGLAFLITSFKLLDLSLPSITAENYKEVKGFRQYFYHKWSMLGLGVILTMITMSVSITFSLLVPLQHRRLIQARHAIPFILGANISTFIDTLFAAFLVNRPGSAMLVLLEIVLVSIVTLFFLLVYEPFESMMLRTLNWITARPWHLMLVVAFLILIPVILILIH